MRASFLHTCRISSGSIVGFIESFPGSLQLLVHGQQVFHSGELPGVFADQEYDVLHLDAALPPERHGFVGHLRDELDDLVLQDVHGLRVGVLVVPEAVHHAAELLGEEPLPPPVRYIRAAAGVLQLLLEAGLVFLLCHTTGRAHENREGPAGL